MEEDVVWTFSTGKAATVTLVVQEDAASGFGMGILPFIDTTLAGNEDKGLPEPLDYKEAASLLFSKVSMGITTMPTGFTVALQKFRDGVSPPTKKAPVIFPEFQRPTIPTG